MHDDSKLVWGVIEPIWSYPTPGDRSARLPFRWLFVKKAQREAYAIVWLEREVTNGGFAQYFHNPWAFFADDVLSGCVRFQIPAIARILRSAIALFPGGSVPKVRQERIARMRQLAAELAARKDRGEDEDDHEVAILNDCLFDPLDVEFYENAESMRVPVATYIRLNPQEFFR